MRAIIIALALMASLSSCVTKRVQDRTLIPAIEAAWPGVRADAEVGGMPVVELESVDSAVETGELWLIDLAAVEAAALLGVDLRLVAGEIGPEGAGIMRDRVTSFIFAVEEATRVVLVKVRDYDARPLVITSSTWATRPPSAIAARTYR
tara:strand:+ start:1472 stop:1918 length:447 start_codon:yes stop_codon:yes gene_type:complete